MVEIAAGDMMVFLCRLLTHLYSYLSKMNEMIYIYIYGILHVQFGTRKLGKSLRGSNFQLSYMHCISERREHTAVANTHVEDLCVGGGAVLLNDMAKLTLSDADLTVLTAFVRKRLVASVCWIMI